MKDVEMPDIFDGLAGGEDTTTVKLLLGFGSEDPTRSRTRCDSEESFLTRSSSGVVK